MGERDLLRVQLMPSTRPGQIIKEQPPAETQLLHGTKVGSGGRARNFPTTGLKEVMFPQGVVDTPFWFSNIGGNHFPREGFTYRPYDMPLVPLRDQMMALQQDEDVQMALNFLVGQITGGQHYWKAISEGASKYMKTFSDDLDFDTFARTVAMELLWTGNSFWRVRGGRHISEVTEYDELMQLPQDSMARIWWTPDRIPLWYEFRGANFNGYFRQDEIIHFTWNKINASVFGMGFGTPLTIRIPYFEDTVNGPREKFRESLLSMKYGTQNNIYKSARRYITRNVYQAPKSTPDERGAMASQIADLDVGEDMVLGSNVTVAELGSSARNYNPGAYMDLVMGSIMKALNTFRGRQAGESQHTYANAENSSDLDAIGLSAFPYALTRQLVTKIFKPWYVYNPYRCKEYMQGLVYMPWVDGDFQLFFGKHEKKDLTAEQVTSLLQVAISHPDGPAITIGEFRKNLELAGIALTKEDEQFVQQQAEEKRKMMLQGGEDKKPEKPQNKYEGQPNARETRGKSYPAGMEFPTTPLYMLPASNENLNKDLQQKGA